MLFTSKSSGLSIWGDVAILAPIAVVAALVVVLVFRPATIVRNGKVTVRHEIRSVTFDATEIRAVTVRRLGTGRTVGWASEAELADGRRILLGGLGCGWAGGGTPPQPDRLAALSEFIALVGLNPEPQIEAAAD